MTNYNSTRALELLRLGCGDKKATFRGDQKDAIQRIVEGERRLLIVQRTGWGKSLVYFIATKLLRENTGGPALLVSPLLALMRNQRQAAERMGVRAESIDSSNEPDWDRVECALQNDEVDILLISPERLANEGFQDDVLAHIAERLSLLVIDEAHCISDWGHDFRPDYRRIARIAHTLPESAQMLATTATANNRVMDDLRAVLGPDLQVLRGDLNRTSLTLQTMRLPGQSERLAWLAEQVPLLSGSGIIYALTVRDVEQVAAWLKSEGVKVEAYSGKAEGREELEQALKCNRVKALVSTTALGMGFDKPDLGFVIHYQAPGSIIAYYQQVGRAGRALPTAYGVLLSGAEETSINNFFIESAFPKRHEVQSVLDALQASTTGLSIPELLGAVNIRRERIEKTIQLLSLESPAPIAKPQGAKWQLTEAELSDDFWIRVERLTSIRRTEQKQMQEYVALPSGHMPFLLSALDNDPDGIDPSNALSSSLPLLSTNVSVPLVQRATEFLRKTNLPIEPRKRWPSGELPQSGVPSSIPQAAQAETGRSLCMWGDAGWGQLVQQGKDIDKRFSNDLVVACKQLVEEWGPDPAPTWVTCVPSLHRPKLVPDFASCLAKALELPFFTALIKIPGHHEQKTRKNSTHQVRNIVNWLKLSDESFPKGPVLLVDDMVNTRWTFTVSAWLLITEARVQNVWPLALAATTRSGTL